MKGFCFSKSQLNNFCNSWSVDLTDLRRGAFIFGVVVKHVFKLSCSRVVYRSSAILLRNVLSLVSSATVTHMVGSGLPRFSMDHQFALGHFRCDATW